MLIENFNRSAQAFALTVVDLSKIQDLPLNDLPVPAATILYNAPVTMFLAVFNAWVALQKHYGHQFYCFIAWCEETWSVLHTPLEDCFLYLSHSAANFSRKIAQFSLE
jgi:hypothetical protein